MPVTFSGNKDLHILDQKNSNAPSLQVYAPGPYGEYIPAAPQATQIVYAANGQSYAVAYPYHYQGKRYYSC